MPIVIWFIEKKKDYYVLLDSCGNEVFRRKEDLKNEIYQYCEDNGIDLEEYCEDNGIDFQEEF